MKMVRIAWLAVAIFMGSGCTAMLLGNGNSSGSAIGRDQRSTMEVARDDALASAVTAALAAEPAVKGSAASISVSARSGNVTLQGTVPTFAVRDRVIQVARDTTGVQQVNNQVQVNSSGTRQ